MQQSPQFQATACPHDCPSTCALEVEVLDETTIGRVRGNPRNDYTAGVICAKVAAYRERVHHPERVTKPLQRVGAKGSGEFREISWDDAIDEVANAIEKARAQYGAEAVWPYHFAGTMGLVQRDSIHRFRHAFGTNMTRYRTPLLALAKMMGHSSPNTTIRYVEIEDAELRALYLEAIEKLLPGDLIDE